MRKLYVFALAISSVLHSETSHNFYSSIGLGMNDASIKHNEIAKDNVKNNFTPTNKPGNLRGAYGLLSLGYIFRINNFGIGSEFFYNIGKLESKISGRHDDNTVDTTNYDINYKITNQKGLNAKFGYFFEKFFLYTLLGTTNQTSTTKIKALRADGAVAGRLCEYYYSKKNKQSRFSYGLGIQKNINDSFDLGLEYKTAKFPNRTATLLQNDAENNKITSDFKYRLHMVGVRLIYKF